VVQVALNTECDDRDFITLDCILKYK
jgi:hypothetical protein